MAQITIFQYLHSEQWDVGANSAPSIYCEVQGTEQKTVPRKSQVNVRSVYGFYLAPYRQQTKPKDKIAFSV